MERGVKGKERRAVWGSGMGLSWGVEMGVEGRKGG